MRADGQQNARSTTRRAVSPARMAGLHLACVPSDSPLDSKGTPSHDLTGKIRARMPITTAAGLLEAIRTARIVPAQQLETVNALAGRFQDPRALARELV